MILDVRGINTFYGLGHILHGLSLAVAEGEVVALLGRNGAGKTTTLRSITGLTPPRTGEIRYKGRDLVGREEPLRDVLHDTERLAVERVSRVVSDVVAPLREPEELLQHREHGAGLRRRPARDNGLHDLAARLPPGDAAVESDRG